MAGWDGDSLAGQMEDVDERSSQLADESTARRAVNEKNRVVAEKLHSLKLSRSRITQQLSLARVDAYRTMLERALDAIDSEISKECAPEDL